MSDPIREAAEAIFATDVGHGTVPFRRAHWRTLAEHEAIIRRHLLAWMDERIAEHGAAMGKAATLGALRSHGAYLREARAIRDTLAGDP